MPPPRPNRAGAPAARTRRRRSRRSSAPPPRAREPSPRAPRAATGEPRRRAGSRPRATLRDRRARATPTRARRGEPARRARRGRSRAAPSSAGDEGERERERDGDRGERPGREQHDQAAELGPDLAAVGPAEDALDDVAAREREDAARRADEREREPRGGEDVTRVLAASRSSVESGTEVTSPSEPAGDGDERARADVRVDEARGRARRPVGSRTGGRRRRAAGGRAGSAAPTTNVPKPGTIAAVPSGTTAVRGIRARRARTSETEKRHDSEIAAVERSCPTRSR